MGVLRPEHQRSAFGNHLPHGLADISRAIEDHGDGVRWGEDLGRDILVSEAVDAIDLARLGRAGERGDALPAAGECRGQITQGRLRAAQRPLARRGHVVVPADEIEEDPVHDESRQSPRCLSCVA